MSGIEDALKKLEAERRQPTSNRLAGSEGVRAAGRPDFGPFSLEAATNVLELDETALAAWGPVSLPGSGEQSKREYGQIKRPIIAQVIGKTAAPAAGSNIVMIASPGPGEGKSLTAINLALSLARERDFSVLLVDADMTKSDLSRVLGLQRASGLSNLIADDHVRFTDIVWKTSLPSLYFIPVGTDHGTTAELLSSRRMSRIVDALAHELPHTITVIDSSPLLLTNESRVLASLAGQVILVVRAGKTPRLLVTEALDYLDPEKPIGLVLNGTSASETAYYAGIYSSATYKSNAKAPD